MTVGRPPGSLTVNEASFEEDLVNDRSLSNLESESLEQEKAEVYVEKVKLEDDLINVGFPTNLESGSLAQEKTEAYTDHDVSKPFPVDPDEPEEDHQLTFRALFVGCSLGAIVGASNIYLGLKTGVAFGGQLFGALLGFAILKTLSTALPASGMLGYVFGGSFGPKENCTVQSAASASGSLGIIFVSAVPSMYQLHLLSEDPLNDIGKLIALGACAAYFGVFFVIPLRKYYIVHQKLVFPTPSATAFTIRSLHRGRMGVISGRKKSSALLFTFVAVFIFKIMTGYAPGILYDWHIGWTLYRIGFSSMIHLENYGWLIEFTPAFFGVGMLTGLNPSLSFLGGSVLAWGIISPSLVKKGLAVGVPISEDYPLVTYLTMSFSDPETYSKNPSPRYWLLWPGVLIMLAYSFADVLLGMAPLVRTMGFSKLHPRHWFTKRTGIDAEDEDQTPLEDRVPFAWWSIGLVCSLIMCCSILTTQFDMNVGEAILSLILGFVLSFVVVQSSGHTDIEPVTTVAKASQLIFGGISKGTGMATKPAQMFNLVAGTIAAGSSGQAADMTGDLKTGYLLRAKPKNQFIAQLCGATVAIFMTSGLFVLFAKAFPCVINPPADGSCIYSAPSAAAWTAVAIAVTSPKLPIPKESGYTAIGLAIASVLTLVIRNYLVPKKYWVYVPNWNAIGLAFVLPAVYYAIAMSAGATFNYIWLIKNPAGYDMYMFAIAAGMIAGEGLGGVVQALLAIVGVDGSKYGTAIGCPGFEFCG